MPILKKPEMVSLVLPISGVTCQLFASYGDSVEIQRVLLDDIKYDMSDKKDKQSSVITGGTLSRQTTYAIAKIVKEWDATELDADGAEVPLAITWENISQLDPQDGQVLSEAVQKLINPQANPAEKKD